MSARFAYVYVLAGANPGVDRKIRDQAAALDRLGVEDFEILVINPRRDESLGPCRFIRPPLGRLRTRYDYAFHRFLLMEHAVDWSQYDRLLLRYPMADPDGPAFANRYSVITEHHTKEVEERIASLASPAPLSQATYRRFSLRRERRYGPPILRASRGIVAVTREILEYERSRSDATLPGAVIGNGIDVERIAATGFRAFDGQTLDLVMVGGRHSPWHGVDRLVRSLGTHRGRLNITCHLIGDLATGIRHGRLPDRVNVVLHGPLFGSALDHLMERMNLAVGTLCLFRKGMQQASTLKTREYAARGIPFVLGHEDVDLASYSGSPFILPVANDDSPIPVDQLVDFTEAMSARQHEEDISATMRRFARERLDWTRKMNELRRFVRDPSRDV